MLKQYDIKSLVLWLTNDCNLRCKYCYAEGGKEKEYMDFLTAKLALQIPKDDNFKLQLAGGEPLLNFQLIEKIHEEISKNYPKVRISMQTNGTLITKKIARRLKEMQISLGISLDGPPSINEELRGKTKEVIEGLKNLANEGVIVNINTVITDKNINHLEKLIDFAYYFGNINGIGLDLLRKSGYADQNDDINVASTEEIELNLLKGNERIKELTKLTGRKIVIREIEEAKQRLKLNKVSEGYCYAVLGQSMIVTPEGDTYPCSTFVKSKDYFMGKIEDNEKLNIFKLNTLEFNNSVECNYCDYKEICPRSCPARLIVNKSFSIQDCIMRKTAFKIAENERSR